jgi:glutamate--cysteine ligase catalytic subunit
VCGLSYEDSFEEMTLDEIFNGKDVYFPGLIPLVYGYLEFIKCEYETFAKIDQYLKFVSR